MSIELFQSVSAVAIGASAGGIAALVEILPSIPADFGLPIFVILHLSPKSENLLPGVLAARCALPVKGAEHGEPVRGGTVYCAPPDYHLLVEQTGYLSLSVDPPVNYSRPSIDVFFESAADAYGPSLIGIILSGANSDGAVGLEQVCAAGGSGIVQERATAEVSVMPAAALARCPAARELPLSDIASLLRVAGTRR